MRLTILALYLALINTFDLLFNTIAINMFNFNYVDLGVFNALWTFIYILSTRFTNQLVDKGFFKKTIALSILFNISMSIVLMQSIVSKNLLLLYVSFSLYAVVVSETRLPIYTSILEYYDNSKWSSVNKALISRTVVFEGLLLLVYSHIGFKLVIENIYLLIIIVLILNILAVFSIPQPILLIERVVFRIVKNINKMLTPARSSLIISFQPIHLMDKSNIYSDLLTKSFVEKRSILIALFGLKISNELLFTSLPLILIRNMSLSVDSILQIYSFAKLLAFILLIAISLNPINPSSMITALFLRLASTTLLFIGGLGVSLIPILISLVFYNNALLDSALYNLYLETSSGYRTSDYTITSEIACFTGSLISGYLVTHIGLSAIITSVFLSTIFFSSILKKM